MASSASQSSRSKSSASRTKASFSSSLYEYSTYSRASQSSMSSWKQTASSHNMDPEFLLGSTLLTPTGENVSTSEVLSGERIKAFGFVFGAQYCSASKDFVKQLSTWYTQDLKDKGLEIIFISLDENEEMFNSFFGQMPWLALSYKEEKRAEFLFREFTNWRIPSFPIFDPNGSLLSMNGRWAIAKDPKGECFPWQSATFGAVPNHWFKSTSSNSSGISRSHWSKSSAEGTRELPTRGLHTSFRTKGAFSLPRERQRSASKRARPLKSRHQMVSPS